MKIIVCGGRDFSDEVYLYECLDSLHKQCWIERLAHGGAPGADNLAGEWARRRGVFCVVYPALWNTYGRSAGPRRNQDMLMDEKPDAVVAFDGGPGTAHMKRISQANRVPVIVFSKSTPEFPGFDTLPKMVIGKLP